jgi:FtsH-binding integral membrane protein
LFAGYVLYDTQLIIGNKSNKFTEEDYILAAMNLYLDIINIFLEILKLLELIRGNN